MKESTKDVFRKHGWRVDRAIHNYLYFRYYYPYIKTLTTGANVMQYFMWLPLLRPMANFIFHRYHSKILSHGDVTKIFQLNESISRISDENKQIVPYKYATKILFDDPENIAVMDCPCKKSTGAPAEDINSCFLVGKGAGFWLDSCKKYNSRKVSQEEALEIIRRMRKKKYINQVFFKVATGGSTGVVCTCHPDHCLSLIATRLTEALGPSVVPVSTIAGYSLKFDSSRCRECGTCADYCHFNAITFENGKRSYDNSFCRGCELCVENCPNGALELVVDSTKPAPLDLDRIKSEMVN